MGKAGASDPRVPHVHRHGSCGSYAGTAIGGSMDGAFGGDLAAPTSTSGCPRRCPTPAPTPWVRVQRLAANVITTGGDRGMQEYGLRPRARSTAVAAAV
ncbi:hypothetical protein Val02_40250 [Virgisporangium aliadipatigenens]|uniref:Uncharacterized protein n=1 Tax=Virgisporangium aliadipatigenens TaxID=741659 RepID=A0A8J4DR08_9ACTN|nr:hypothetical protein Val02_40250 [Virgisporangium aliadipatigenens]